jgi:phosphatidylglycerophosphate synthase
MNKLRQKAMSTLKSSETEDWLDYRVIRPLSYLWAVLFAKLDIHPNTVTIMSMIIGAGSAYFYAQPSFYYGGTYGLMMNIIAVLLLLWADIFDCCDGQLARMTGKKSRLGRILDGVAGFAWFVPIYIVLVYRFYCRHDIEFGWLGIENNEQNTLIATAIVFVLGLISGIAGLSGQQRLADYYIQVHLFFLKGEQGSELDNSAQQQKIYDETPWKGNKVWKFFLKNYVAYTRKQEATTPQFQRMMAAIKEKYGSASNIPASLREEILQHSRGVMPFNGALTFNFRTAFFWLFCLCDIPAMNFVWEIVGMGLLWAYTRHRHEAFCKDIADRLTKL